MNFCMISFKSVPSRLAADVLVCARRRELLPLHHIIGRTGCAVVASSSNPFFIYCMYGLIMRGCLSAGFARLPGHLESGVSRSSPN